MASINFLYTNFLEQDGYGPIDMCAEFRDLTAILLASEAWAASNVPQRSSNLTADFISATPITVESIYKLRLKVRFELSGLNNLHSYASLDLRLD